jgi:chemotaxis protein methyltransferase CheR
MPVSTASFEWISSLLEKRAGNLLESDKTYLVEARLTPLAQATGAVNVDALVDRLRSTPDLERQIVEAMLTHESSFFRDSDAFEALTSQILPRLIERRRDRRELTIWSAACAAGQEPYSLAMLMKEQFAGSFAGWTVRIVATDLSRPMLDQARSGSYNEIKSQRGLSPERRQRFFRQEDRAWVIREELRESIEFREINLCTDPPPLRQFDLVLLRNVLIYLTEPARQKVLARVAGCLADDGSLLLGATESIPQQSQIFVRDSECAVSCFRPAAVRDSRKVAPRVQ